MPNPLRNSARVRVLVNGQLLRQLQNVRITGDSGKQVMHSMDDTSFKGFGEGETVKQITGTYNIDETGFEWPFESYVMGTNRRTFATVQVFIGPNSYAGNGQFTANDAGGGVGEVATGTFTWIGEAAPIE